MQQEIKTSVKNNKKNKSAIIIVLVLLFVLLTVFVALAITGAWFADNKNSVVTVTTGSVEIEWAGEQGTLLEGDTFNLGDTISGASTFNKELYIKNTGSSEAYLRVKIDVAYNDGSALSPNWVSIADVVSPTNLDLNKWIVASGDYYYYKGLNAVVENAKYGCLYLNEFVPFASAFAFKDALPEVMIGKTIKVSLICEGIQERNEAVGTAWAGAPNVWLSNLGYEPNVYIEATSSAPVNQSVFTSIPNINLSLRNLGSNNAFVKLDFEIVVSNGNQELVPLFSFSNANVTYSTSDGKYYLNNILVHDDSATELSFAVAFNNSIAASIEGVSYTIKINIETLEYNNAITLEHAFFVNAPAGYVVPGGA